MVKSCDSMKAFPDIGIGQLGWWVAPKCRMTGVKATQTGNQEQAKRETPRLLRASARSLDNRVSTYEQGRRAWPEHLSRFSPTEY